jgi:hypothetical protein
MRKFLYPIAMMATFSFLTSCATIFTGTEDTIRFNSKPEGAGVYKDGLELCETPCKKSVDRSLSDVDVEFKLEGYENRVITLDREFNTISILNLGSILGWGVDAATGSIFKYDRKAYDIEMTKED